MIVIVDGVRTAMGGFQGSLSSCTAPELGAVTIKEVLNRSGLQPIDVDEVIFGCVLPAGLKQGPARQAMRMAGLPDSTGATTINKICGSGMKAVMQAADAIKAGSAEIVVAVVWSQCQMRRTYLKKHARVTVWDMVKPPITCSKKV